MCSRLTNEYPDAMQRGFTLLELLLVLGLLALLAGMALLAYDDVQPQARVDAARHDMAEIRQALLQFRRDSGNHSLPGTGSYDCDDDPAADSSVPNPQLNFPAMLTTAAEKLTWCRHPANFWMLFEDPAASGWNPDTRQGWNGPYLGNRQHTINDSNGHPVPTILDPYQQPYQLRDLQQDASASIVSGGENKLIGTLSECRSDDTDDLVLCLLR